MYNDLNLDTFLEGMEEKEVISEASFSRKHYQMVADLLKGYIESNDQKESEVATAIGESFAEMFSMDNDRFDKERYLKAMGL
jgi:hypothetical protein